MSSSAGLTVAVSLGPILLPELVLTDEAGWSRELGPPDCLEHRHRNSVTEAMTKAASVLALVGVFILTNLNAGVTSCVDQTALSQQFFL